MLNMFLKLRSAVTIFSMHPSFLFFPRKALLRKSIFFMAASCSLNEIDNSKTQIDQFSHGFLIKQTSVTLINSATTVLTVVTNAMLDAQEQYLQAMKEMLKLLDYSKTYTSADEDIWDMNVLLRAEIQEKKNAWLVMESQMTSVTNVMNAVAEMAFSAGAEYIGIAANERLISAQQQLLQAKEQIHRLEAEILKSQAEDINREAEILKSQAEDIVSDENKEAEILKSQDEDIVNDGNKETT